MNKLPSNETLWLTRISDSGKTLLITSNKDRSTYFIYEQTDSGLEKLGKGLNPLELERKFVE